LRHVSFDGSCLVSSVRLLYLGSETAPFPPKCRGDLHNRDTKGADDFQMSTVPVRQP